MQTPAFLGGYGVYHQRFGRLFPKADPRHVINLLAYCYMGIPVKVNIDSGGKPNGIPERR